MQTKEEVKKQTNPIHMVNIVLSQDRKKAGKSFIFMKVPNRNIDRN